MIYFNFGDVLILRGGVRVTVEAVAYDPTQGVQIVARGAEGGQYAVYPSDLRPVPFYQAAYLSPQDVWAIEGLPGNVIAGLRGASPGVSIADQWFHFTHEQCASLNAVLEDEFSWATPPNES